MVRPRSYDPTTFWLRLPCLQPVVVSEGRSLSRDAPETRWDSPRFRDARRDIRSDSRGRNLLALPPPETIRRVGLLQVYVYARDVFARLPIATGS